MKDNQWGKLAAIAGVVFAVTFVAGLMLVSGGDETKPSDEFVLKWWADSGHQTNMILGAYLLVLSGVAFIWFIANVRGRLIAGGGTRGQLDVIVLVAGAAFVPLLMGGALALVGPAAAVKFGDTDLPKDPDILRQLPQLGFGMILVGAAFAAALCIATVSICIRSTGGFAPWLAWLGFACAFLLLFGAVFIPLIALPVWALATSVELWRRPVAGAAS